MRTLATRTTLHGGDMLKRILGAALVLVLLSAMPLVAQQAPAQQPPGDKMTLTGQVIDVNCFTTHGAQGASHKQCATACANKGVGLAILSSDGTIYMPVSSKPADPQTARLAPFAEGKVKITGTHRMQSGLHTIEIETIEATPAS
jgi:type 1 fimbria pilin